MTDLMISLGKLTVGFVFIAAPLAFLIALLYAQDHRKRMIEGIVGKELNSPDLRGIAAANTKCALLSNSCTVEADIWDAPGEQMWNVLDRLRENLPSNVRLLVTEYRLRLAKMI
jgi:hypothetical protein